MRIHIDFFGCFDIKKQYSELLKELEAYRKKSIKLVLDGRLSTPYEIAEAHLVLEEGCYMRDYVENEDGCLAELWFQRINV